MADNALTPDLTPEAIDQANALLNFLVQRSVPNWNDLMKMTLTQKELEANNKLIEDILNKQDALLPPVGAVKGGTGIAKEEAGLPGEEGQRAIRLLKAANRLVQCGRGRGKCLVILDSTSVTANDFKNYVEQPKKAVAKVKPRGEEVLVPVETPEVDLTVDQLLKLARDKHRSVTQELADKNAIIRELEQRMAEYEGILAARQETINRLEKDLQERTAVTWQ